MYANSGWVYLRRPLDRESRDVYRLQVTATDNGSPPASASANLTVYVSDANDNDPVFSSESYRFTVEENLPRGAPVGLLMATDRDLGANAALTYSLIPANSSFQVNPTTVVCKERRGRKRERERELQLASK
ncbi:hypothetical protein LSTR_LSTR016908 [Laodelphax striatellus]|uniref:Cadherin domain-containing protein n=1 Tax=Laodelphax striatellus TaxID=195883 RepID=A0A482X5Y1_LAOST|nr:hypothetical protein LSTR_LSTR016908 [Laodelphax striatellus]